MAGGSPEAWSHTEGPGRTVQAEGRPARRSGRCPGPTACGEFGEQAGRGLTRTLTGSRGQTLPAAKAAVIGEQWATMEGPQKAPCY